MDDCWDLCVVYVLQTSMDINRQLILNPCESMQSLFYCVLWLDSVILHAKISLMHEKLVKKSDCSVRKSLLWVLDTRASTDHSYLRHLFCGSIVDYLVNSSLANINKIRGVNQVKVVQCSFRTIQISICINFIKIVAG